MILPNDPADLITDYKFSEKYIKWTKEILNKNPINLWQTSDACFLVRRPFKKVALMSYNTEGSEPEIVRENIARFKKVTNLLGWEFGYDATLGETIKLESDVDRHIMILEKLSNFLKNNSIKFDGIDVEKSTKEFCDFIKDPVVAKL